VWEVRFDPSSIPVEAHEAMMGLFALKLGRSRVALLHHDGTAEIVSLEDYIEYAAGSPTDLANAQLDLPVSSLAAYLDTRSGVAAHLNTATVPPGILKLRTAAPLNGVDTLLASADMLRYTATKHDVCFDSTQSELRSNTYLTPLSERAHVSVGYGVVGRYSLPCPYPARYLHGYRLSKGASFRVGTVEPQFGQSGGGVEICLDADTSVQYLGYMRISDY